MKVFSIFLFVLLAGCQAADKSPLESILENGSDSFQEILKNPKHDVQIILGKISNNQIEHLFFQVDASKFFYPASTVKMPVALAAIQRLQELEMPLSSEISIDSSSFHPRALSYDSLYQGPLTIEHLIEKIFVYSDNQAYNILYNWLGKDYINQLHDAMGVETRIIHQLSESAFSFSEESNRVSSGATLRYEEDSTGFGTTVDEFGNPQNWENTMNPSGQIRGVGYMSGTGAIVNEPFDFNKKNFVPLTNLLGSLERVVKPELFEATERYSFDQTTYDKLANIMAMRPRNLPSPIDTLPDNYVKFFLFGDQENDTYPTTIEIRNKVGWAYGYLTDIAYIKDHENDIEFFLAATIHVNENETYNDGVYEYEEIGLPFLGELGRLVHTSLKENK